MHNTNINDFSSCLREKIWPTKSKHLGTKIIDTIQKI